MDRIKNSKKIKKFCSFLLSASMLTVCSQGILMTDLYAADDGNGSEPATVFYVAPNDNSEYNGNGTFEMPFSEINEANEAIALMSPDQRAGGVTVYIRGGDYYQDKTLMCRVLPIPPLFIGHMKMNPRL